MSTDDQIVAFLLWCLQLSANDLDLLQSIADLEAGNGIEYDPTVH